MNRKKELIQKELAKKGMTWKELSEAVNISERTIRHQFASKRLSVITAKGLSEFFKIPLEELL